MILKTLPLNVENIKLRPEVFITEINEVPYKFKFTYNTYDKKIYLSIYEDLTGKVLIEGRKVIYGNNLVEYCLVDFDMVPLDFSGTYRKVNYESLSNSMNIYFLVGDENA